MRLSKQLLPVVGLLLALGGSAALLAYVYYAELDRIANPPDSRTEVAEAPEAEVQRPVVTNVNLVGLTADEPVQLLACDARTNRVLLMDLAATTPEWKTLGEALYPARATVTDLDGDGIPDVLVANLGVFFPSDE